MGMTNPHKAWGPKPRLVDKNRDNMRHSKLLQRIQGTAPQNVWFMHDGAPAHFLIVVSNYFHTTCLGRWIERGRLSFLAPQTLISWISSSGPLGIICVWDTNGEGSQDMDCPRFI
ncbi:hypothetical protein TNCV_1293431 [Trichonephila clavipes]|nr:hypothetical protein TNCV_1293431 [Trichonephila clavipes]